MNANEQVAKRREQEEVPQDILWEFTTAQRKVWTQTKFLIEIDTEKYN